MEPIQPAIGMMMSVVMMMLMMDMVVTTNQILITIIGTLEGVDFGPGDFKNAFCPDIIDPVQGNVDINHDKSIIYSSWKLQESKFDKGWRSCAMLTGKERHRKRREGVNRSQGCKY